MLNKIKFISLALAALFLAGCADYYTTEIQVKVLDGEKPVKQAKVEVSLADNQPNTLKGHPITQSIYYKIVKDGTQPANENLGLGMRFDCTAYTNAEGVATCTLVSQAYGIKVYNYAIAAQNKDGSKTGDYIINVQNDTEVSVKIK